AKSGISLDSPAMNHSLGNDSATRVPAEHAQASGAQPANSPHDATESSTLAWVGPFVVFMVWLALDKDVPIAYPWKELARDAVLLAAILGFSRRVLPRSAPHWLASVALGIAVFILWVAPDVLVSSWRSHWLFQNDVAGKLKTSIPPAEL